VLHHAEIFTAWIVDWNDVKEFVLLHCCPRNQNPSPFEPIKVVQRQLACTTKMQASGYFYGLLVPHFLTCMQA
jgi:hypothetical protein